VVIIARIVQKLSFLDHCIQKKRKNIFLTNNKSTNYFDLCIVRRLLAIIFIVLFSASALLKLLLVVNYMAQYDYYKTVLCENKNKPELKCNGTCQLAKELKAAEKPVEVPTVPASLEIQELLFVNAQSTKIINLPLPCGTYHSTNDRLPTLLFVEEVSEPPRV